MPKVSAVLFARDLQRVGEFYEKALGMRREHFDAEHIALDCHGFSLIIHQIPAHLINASMSAACDRREDAALRLSIPVTDVDAARRAAQLCGGCIDSSPPAWATATARVFLGHDPEGNVLKVSDSLTSGSS
jgi:predicted enzyme related to lactoylglutathione lyase